MVIKGTILLTNVKLSLTFDFPEMPLNRLISKKKFKQKFEKRRKYSMTQERLGMGILGESMLRFQSVKGGCGWYFGEGGREVLGLLGNNHLNDGHVEVDNGLVD